MNLKEQILEYLEITGVKSKPIQISNGICGDYSEVRMILFNLRENGLVVYNHDSNTYQVVMDKEYTEGTDINKQTQCAKIKEVDMELKLPEETVDIFHEYCGLIKCRDKSIKSFFSYKRAGFYGKMASKKRYEFWRSVKTVYPEHKNKGMDFDVENEVLTINDKEAG